jgi:hypothetical protein
LFTTSQPTATRKQRQFLDDQVRGVYRLYRTFGGDDMESNRPSRDYRNTFQYAAIVTSKGALMFVELQQSLGDEKIFAALRNYYRANLFEIAQLEDLAVLWWQKLRLNKDGWWTYIHSLAYIATRRRRHCASRIRSWLVRSVFRQSKMRRRRMTRTRLLAWRE